MQFAEAVISQRLSPPSSTQPSTLKQTTLSHIGSLLIRDTQHTHPMVPMYPLYVRSVMCTEVQDSNAVSICFRKIALFFWRAPLWGVESVGTQSPRRGYASTCHGRTMPPRVYSNRYAGNMYSASTKKGQAAFVRSRELQYNIVHRSIPTGLYAQSFSAGIYIALSAVRIRSPTGISFNRANYRIWSRHQSCQQSPGWNPFHALPKATTVYCTITVR